MDADEVAWGYGGAGPWEAATSVLTDYLGFLPWPELRGRFKDEVVAQLPGDGFVLPVAQLDAWHDAADSAARRGLVVVASPSSLDWPAGSACTIGLVAGQALKDAGFDVYEPGRNAEVPHWKSRDRRLHGLLHESLLSALDACSMLVVPVDGYGIVHGIESNVGLWYALQHRDVPCLIAYARAEEGAFSDYDRYGVDAVEVVGSRSYDVSAVVAAVDRTCAAFECLHSAAGPQSSGAT